MIQWIHHCTLTIIGKKPDSVEHHKLNNKGEYLKVLTDDLHNAGAELVHFSNKWALRSKGLWSDWHQTCYSLTRRIRFRVPLRTDSRVLCPSLSLLWLSMSQELLKTTKEFPQWWLKQRKQQKSRFSNTNTGIFLNEISPKQKCLTNNQWSNSASLLPS